MEDLSYLERNRHMVYLVTEDNWFIHLKDDDTIETVCQIDDATSFYAEYDAIELYLRCVKSCISCRIIKYDVKYKPVDELYVI